MRDVQLVVFHRPGSAWAENVSFRDQPGVGEHVAHYRGLLEAGKLAEGGPFLDGSGGMMVATPGLPRAELEAFAAADPAVKSGLLRYEIRDWLVAFRK